MVIETEHYTVRWPVDSMAITVLREGIGLLQLPLVAGLSTPTAPEHLSQLQAQPIEQQGDMIRLTIQAESSCWQARRFVWEFGPTAITFQHMAEGSGPLGQCFFCSNGIPTPWSASSEHGIAGNARVNAEHCFTPRLNHANQLFHDIAMPQSLGILNESPVGRVIEGNPGQYFLPEHYTRLFCPPPLMLAFGSGEAWVGLEIGDQPGNYQFNSFEYSGARFSGASFSVDYHGYRSSTGSFASPVLALHFGYSPYQVLAEHIGWVNTAGFGTVRRAQTAAWHREPIVCGWAEQGVLASHHGGRAADYATQAWYERWIALWEQRGLPFGTIVIDDKWQRHYGTFEIDTAKWPDMPGFVARQHAQGRRVLLWVPGHHREGLDPALCVHYQGQPVTGDVSNPAYEAFLRERISDLMLHVGVDGFKEDWIGGLVAVAGLETHAPLFGIEFLRRFQFILHDQTHQCKADALVETQTPHPLFYESSDMLRLNDLWFAARDVPAIMRARARIARIAGWDVIDCDNASSTTLAEWRQYMQIQPSIGVPSLYFANETESTFEQPSDAQWAYLAELWRRYRYEQGLATAH
ncbi:MAG: hypothetical protein Fur005_40270 [Roseiflexaceae bacterium]